MISRLTCTYRWRHKVLKLKLSTVTLSLPAGRAALLQTASWCVSLRRGLARRKASLWRNNHLSESMPQPVCCFQLRDYRLTVISGLGIRAERGADMESNCLSGVLKTICLTSPGYLHRAFFELSSMKSEESHAITFVCFYIESNWIWIFYNAPKGSLNGWDSYLLKSVSLANTFWRVK